jgi:hypothetical protein
VRARFIVNRAAPRLELESLIQSPARSSHLSMIPRIRGHAMDQVQGMLFQIMLSSYAALCRDGEAAMRHSSIAALTLHNPS